MATSGFGKVKYGGEGWGNQWGPKEGDNHIRIAPPMHSLAESGKWSAYHGIHFGYHGVDSKDKTKTRNRPFKCIQKKQRNGIVEQECPACDEVEAYKAKLDAEEAALVAAGTPKDVIATKLAGLKTWLKDHNVDRKHYMNVLIPTGEVGFFKISHKTKKVLDLKIKDVQAQYNLDPIEPDQGVWFNIKRVGKFLDAVDSVELVMVDVVVGGRKLQDIKPGALSEAECTKLLTECKDVAFVGTELTFDQIKAVVEAAEDPEEIDRIFDGNKKTETKAPVKAPAEKAPPKTAEKKTTTDPAAPAVNPAIAARLEAIAAKKKAAEEAAKAAEEAARAEAAALEAAAEAGQEDVDEPEDDVAPEEDPNELSDEDFLKKFSPKK